MIDAFEFGTITIQGQTYTTDVMIFPDGRVADGWWRKHGHRLSMRDLETLLANDPEVIVVGAGIHGRMLPETGLQETIRDLGVELIIGPNDQAVPHFNRLVALRRTAGGFHLTC